MKLTDYSSSLNQSKYPPPFYENKIVDGEYVIVQVTELNSYSAQVVCLEYGNFPGKIMYNELSKRNFGASLSKITKMGSRECCLVLFAQNNELVLSKKRVSQEIKLEYMNKYQKSLKVLQIMEEFVFQLHQIEINTNSPIKENSLESKLKLNNILDNNPSVTKEDLIRDLNEYYKKIVYPCHSLFGHCYDGFRECLLSKEKKNSVFSRIFNAQKLFWKDKTPEEFKRIQKNLFQCIRKRLKIRPIKMRATIEVSCFSYRGIESVKDALIYGRNACGGEVEIQINLIAHPLFSLTCVCNDVQSGKKYLIMCMQNIKDKILEEKEGKFKCIEPPKEVSQGSESNLAIIMQRLENENKEVDGDDDFEEGLEVDPAIDKYIPE